ncbi:M14 family metallopeptidase [Nonlabens agnitus]|nr:M14 family metallocarboxypeptidase [Nonlabens agnitus]
MRSILFLLLGAIGVSCSPLAQPVPQRKEITERFFADADTIKNVTPALQKDRGFTNYEELTGFLSNLESKKPDWIDVSYIGESQKGYKVPMITISNKSAQGEKIKVWMQAGLHGNEPASTEGLLYLLHELVNNPEYTYLLDKLDIRAVPMANIDGYLKQSRYAKNGLDLNRDQTKLMAPESVFLKQEFSNYDAQVALDFHEYNPFRRDFAKMSSFGIIGLYDIMFLTSGNLNVPQNLRTLTDSLFVGNTMKVLDQNGLTHHQYISTTDYKGAIHFNQGSNNSRSSATSYALTNAVSSLIEVRGVKLNKTSFKRRITTTFLVGLSYLETAYNNDELVRKTIQQAQKGQESISVTSSKTVYEGTIEAIDVDTREIIKMEVTLRDAIKMNPELTRKRPEAYLINKNQKKIVEKLKVLGVELEQLSEEKNYSVESFQVTNYDRANAKYEKMNLQDVRTKLEKKSITFPRGTYIIYTDQKNAPIITEVLEPEAPNSFVSFGVLETDLNRELPIYRLPKTIP